MNIKKVKNRIVQKIPRDFGQVFTFNMISKFLTAIISVLLIRGLNINAYASYTVFFSLSNLILGVLGHSIGLSYIRFSAEEYSKDKSKKDNIVFPAMVFVSLSALLILILAYMFNDELNILDHILISSIFVGWLMSCQQIIISYFQAREKYNIAGIIMNLRNITLVISLIVVFAIMEEGRLNATFFSYWISSISVTIIAFYYIYRKGNIGYGLTSKDTIKFVKVSLWLMLYNLATQILGQIDVQMLRLYTDDYNVAVYGVAFKYISMMALLLPSLKTVLRVRMSKHDMTTSLDKQKDFAKVWIRKSFFPSAIITIVAILFAQFGFTSINGKQYDAAIIPFQIMSLSMFFSYIFAPSSGLVMSMGKYKMQFVIALVALVVKIFGNIILIEEYGVIGVSITYGISYFIINCSFAVYVLLINQD